MSEVKNEIIQKNITDSVLKRVNQMQQLGDLKLPKDYSPENALKSAYLILQETKNKENKFALQYCTQTSIANALLEMVISGLSPAKKQCYFLMYADKLQLSTSYFGRLTLAKRFGNVKDVRGFAIFKGDEFEFEVDVAKGIKYVTKHKQKLENLKPDNVIGAYAIVYYEDGSTNTEVMNIEQIKKSWNMGQMNGNSKAHKEFTDQMAIKTVISRACKLAVNSSNDNELLDNLVEDKPNYDERSTEDKVIDMQTEIDNDDVVDVDIENTLEAEDAPQEVIENQEQESDF